MENQKAEIRGWDPVWEQVFRNQEWGKYPPEYVIRFVARNWYQSPNRAALRLLDLGSGPGACTWYMSREGFSVAAIDGSETAIERLRARLAKEHLSVEAKVGDFVRLPWADAVFDGVIDNVSVCSNPFSTAKLVIREVLRVLKPGGHFLSAAFTDRCWGYGKGTRRGSGAFESITEGPLAGKGLILFMG